MLSPKCSRGFTLLNLWFPLTLVIPTPHFTMIPPPPCMCQIHVWPQEATSGKVVKGRWNRTCKSLSWSVAPWTGPAWPPGPWRTSGTGWARRRSSTPPSRSHTGASWQTCAWGNKQTNKQTNKQIKNKFVSYDRYVLCNQAKPCLVPHHYDRCLSKNLKRNIYSIIQIYTVPVTISFFE